jgi:hypothetical protein
MPPHPCPHHCPKPGGGGAALLVLAAVVIAAAGRAIAHTIGIVVEVVLVTTISLAGLAAVAVAALVARHVMRSHARERQAIARQGQAVQAVSGPRRRAIEAPGPRPHTLSTSERERAGRVTGGVVIRDETRER